MNRANAPRLFTGEAKSLRSVLRLGDQTPQKTLQREVTLQGEDGQAVSVLATLSPDGTQKTRLNMEVLDPYAAPGAYHGDFEVENGFRQAVTVQIPEVTHLKIVPGTLVIDAADSATITKLVSFENAGNVPLTLGYWGNVPLGEEFPLAVGRENRNRSVLDVLSNALRDDTEAPPLKQIGEIEIHNATGVTVLNPGDMENVVVEICLPDNLSANKRYHAFLPLYTSDLQIVVTPVQK